MKIFIVLISLCVIGVGEKNCKSRAQDSKSGTHSSTREPQVKNDSHGELEYEVLMTGCSEDNTCSVIAYCDSALFNEKDMEKIAEKLSIDYKEKKVVNVNLFDDKEVAKSYAKGTRGLGGLQNERRGWYLRTDDREFLLFSSDPKNRDKLISVKPKGKHN